MASHSEQATQSGIAEAPNNHRLSRESLSDSHLLDEHVSEDHPSDVKTDDTPNPSIRALEGNNSTSDYPVGTMAKFPSTFYCKATHKKIDKKRHTLYLLGHFVRQDDPALFTVIDEKKVSFKEDWKGIFRLHVADGPNHDDPVLIRADCVNRIGHVRAKNGNIYNILLPSLEALPSCEKKLNVDNGWATHRVKKLGFDMEINGIKESFEWRPTHGRETKKLHNVSRGWKLARKTNATPDLEHGGKRKKRSFGFCSDGAEIMAILTRKKHHRAPKMKHGCYRFSFMGSGLTGTLGQRWETLAVISGHLRWTSYVKEQQVASRMACAGGGGGAVV